MCSILTNTTVDNQLNKLERSSDRNMIEKRLYDFAKESDINTSGVLDETSYSLKRMPHELSNIKKIRIGRHRIYYHGHYSKCSYFVFYIKQFKKDDKDIEDDKQFQKKLIRFFNESSSKEILPL